LLVISVMGIKHLKILLSQLCKSGIEHFSTMSDFLTNEKNRMYKNIVCEKKINNPIQQEKIKKSIESKPYCIGIDAYLYALRYKRVFKKMEFGFLRQIMNTLSSGIIPVYIFDGSAPEEKRNTIVRRQANKQKIRIKLENLLFSNVADRPDFLSELTLDELINHISNTFHKLYCIDMQTDTTNFITSEITDNKNESNILLYNNLNTNSEYNEFVRLSKKSIGLGHEDIQNLKKFLDLLKIPYVIANREADDLMAYLYKKNIIQACQSDDMDMLPRGCGNVIQITSNGISQYILQKILEELKLSYHQFIDLCVLLGSDYNTYFPKIKPMELYNIFIKIAEPSLEKFVSEYSLSDPKILLYLQAYQYTRKIFMSLSEETDQKKIIKQLVPLNMNVIVEYFNSLNIRFSKEHEKKLRFMLKNVNNFIMSTNL
jgi:5'-3' exonuclease